MKAAAVLDDLQALGVTIEVQGDKLRFWPRSAVGPQVLEEMRLHKAELVALLTAPVEVVVGDHYNNGGHHDDYGKRHNPE